MKTRVIIDGVCCDLEAGFAAPRNLLHFSDEECGRGGRHTSHEVDIVLPSSPTNDALLCYAADAHAIERFNQQEHTATIEVDGVALLEGQAALVAVRSEGSKGVSYDLRIRRRGDNWRAKMHRKRLADTALDYSVTLNAAAIERSWRGEQKVRFLPVHFDQYVVPYDSRSLYPPQHNIGVDNYMPFISVDALVRQIFAEAGYEVESRFMESDLWHKLYISGRYEQSGRSAERLDAVAGVCAGRTGEATTQADSAGRAYMSRGVLVSSLGSFVDTAGKHGSQHQFCFLFLTNNDTGNIFTQFPCQYAYIGVLHEVSLPFRIHLLQLYCTFPSVCNNFSKPYIRYSIKKPLFPFFC